MLKIYQKSLILYINCSTYEAYEKFEKFTQLSYISLHQGDYIIECKKLYTKIKNSNMTLP